MNQRNAPKRSLSGLALPILLLAMINSAPAGPRNAGANLQPRLKSGDIIYADSGDAIRGGAILRVDSASGQSSVISSGGLLQMPFGVLVDAGGTIVVSDSGRLIGIDPVTGTQALLADNSQAPLGTPYGIALNQDGNVIAANLSAVIEISAQSGQVRTISAGGLLGVPIGITTENGSIFVLCTGATRQIVEVDAQTGDQRLVAQRGLLKNPQALTVHGADIYVTDVATSDGNFGIGCIIHVDAQTGAQSIVSKGANLVGPVGIDVAANGRLIIGDPYTINPQSPDLADGGFDGAILLINPADGSQNVLTRGQGSFVNPRGVALVRAGNSGNR
jgi:hypothetical protein